jgi:hypothetical protein
LRIDLAHQVLAQLDLHDDDRVARRLQGVGRDTDVDVPVRVGLIEIALRRDQVALAVELALPEPGDSQHDRSRDLLTMTYVSGPQRL